MPERFDNEGYQAAVRRCSLAVNLAFVFFACMMLAVLWLLVSYSIAGLLLVGAFFFATCCLLARAMLTRPDILDYFHETPDDALP